MRISDWSSDVCSSDLRDLAPGEGRGHHRQHQQDRGLADRAVQGHRAAGGARDDGAAAEVEEGGILQSRVAATHGVCPRKGVSVQARYEDTGQTVSRPLQGERLRGAEPARWVVRKGGLEPPRLAAPAPKAGASPSSATFEISAPPPPTP